MSAQAWAAAALASASDADTLYHDTAAKHEILQRQHDQSRQLLQNALTEAHRNIGSLLNDTEALHSKHLALEDEIIDFKLKLSSALAAPSSSADKTLHEEIQALHERIQELEAAQSYFASLDTAEQLSIQAVKSIQAGRLDPALQAYRSLVSYQQTLSSAGPANLQSHAFVRDLAESTFAALRSTLSSKLNDALEGLDWPTRSAEILQEIETPKGLAFQQAFLDLLALQTTRENVVPDQPRLFLLPLETLVQPLHLRFRYHFEGSRQTNRLDKPEWYFAHVLNLLSTHARFVQVLVQALLREAGYERASAMNDFVGLLLGFVTRRLEQTMPELLELPPIMAHTIFQALQFDQEIKDRYHYEEDESVEWQGTVNTILGNAGWFDGWKEAEKKYTEDKFYEIISAPDAWQLNKDYAESSLRPTNSALRVRDLFEQVTSRYRALPLFSCRLAFLLTIQVPLLDAYLSRIQSAVDAMESQQMGILRAVPGALDNARQAGVSVLNRLVRVYVTAQWMTSVLQAWSDDLFFLDFWDDLKNLSTDDLDETSMASLQSLRDDEPAEDAALFSNYIAQFASVASRAEEMSIKHVQKEVLGELKPYFAKRWDLPTVLDEPPASVLSPELSGPLTLYTTLLAGLKEALPMPQLQACYRKIASTFAEHLYGRVATAKIFSATGGQQLLEDVQFGWLEAARDQGIRRPEVALTKIRSAAVLLALPAGESAGQTSFAKAVAAAWDSDAAFTNLAERLGADGLTRREAQAVLKKRPECWRV